MKLPNSKLQIIPLMVIPLLLFITASVQRQGLRKLDAKPLVNPASRKVDGETYYTNLSCPMIFDPLNCFKFGRPDSDFLKWRWKPDRCKLPMLDARRLLELVRGKSMAFVGDSLGRNQIHSLQCILAGVDNPKDTSDEYTHDGSILRWYFPRYDFMVATFWAPYLVNATSNDSIISYTSTVNLDLDEPDAWCASEFEKFDFVIISAAHWLFHQNYI